MRIRAGSFPEPHAPDVYQRVLPQQGFRHDREVVRHKRHQGAGTHDDREDPGTRVLLQHRNHVRGAGRAVGMPYSHEFGTGQELD